MKVELFVDRLAKSGDGVASYEGRTVFVEGALPGERVSALLHEGKVLRADLLAVLQASPSRRPPPCPLADRCGGCSWLHLEEGAQRAAKEEIVTSTLEHLGGIERAAYTLLPTVFGPHALAYRRRAAMHPVEGGLGFNGRRSHTRVRVDACPAMVAELSALIPQIVAALGSALKELDEVRLLEQGGKRAVSLHVRGAVRPGLRTRAEALLKGVEGVALVAPGAPVVVLGDRALRADAFAQANEEVNARLVSAAAAALQCDSKTVLELYAGAGNFTRALGAARAVTAVEVAPVSAALANTRWVRGDVEKVVKGLLKEGARFERLLLDPPRAGAAGVGSWAASFGVSRVVYVACDPASLARDAADLRAKGFRPETLQLFDMFPQTHHVEAVMGFAR